MRWVWRRRLSSHRGRATATLSGKNYDSFGSITRVALRSRPQELLSPPPSLPPTRRLSMRRRLNPMLMSARLHDPKQHTDIYRSSTVGSFCRLVPYAITGNRAGGVAARCAPDTRDGCSCRPGFIEYDPQCPERFLRCCRIVSGGAWLSASRSQSLGSAENNAAANFPPSICHWRQAISRREYHCGDDNRTKLG